MPPKPSVQTTSVAAPRSTEPAGLFSSASSAGSLIGAILVAFVQVFGTYYFPDFALAFMYLIMLTVLVVRPGGLLGKEA